MTEGDTMWIDDNGKLIVTTRGRRIAERHGLNPRPYGEQAHGGGDKGQEPAPAVVEPPPAPCVDPVEQKVPPTVTGEYPAKELWQK